MNKDNNNIQNDKAEARLRQANTYNKKLQKSSGIRNLRNICFEETTEETEARLRQASPSLSAVPAIAWGQQLSLVPPVAGPVLLSSLLALLSLVLLLLLVVVVEVVSLSLLLPPGEGRLLSLLHSLRTELG